MRLPVMTILLIHTIKCSKREGNREYLWPNAPECGIMISLEVLEIKLDRKSIPFTERKLVWQSDPADLIGAGYHVQQYAAKGQTTADPGYKIQMARSCNGWMDQCAQPFRGVDHPCRRTFAPSDVETI